MVWRQCCRQILEIKNGAVFTILFKFVTLQDMDNTMVRGVIFLIENEAHRFLLEQRNENSKLSKWEWVFPGGAIDEGEDSLRAVIREAEEEFGIKFGPDNCIKIGTAPTHSGRGLNELWHCLLKNLRSPLIITESAGAGWFTFDEIRKMELGYRQTELVIPVLDSKF